MYVILIKRVSGKLEVLMNVVLGILHHFVGLVLLGVDEEAAWFIQVKRISDALSCANNYNTDVFDKRRITWRRSPKFYAEMYVATIVLGMS